MNLPLPNDWLMRHERLRELLRERDADACLLHSTVHIYYLSGVVFDGYIFVPQAGEALFFVRRPVLSDRKNVFQIRKPEEIPGLLKKEGYALPKVLALEADQLTYNEFRRLEEIFGAQKTVNVTPILRQARMIKTAWEVGQFRASASLHVEVYKQITSLFVPGMTDLDLQCEIERLMRQRGSLGIFRAFGSRMDIFMGSLLTGDNAAVGSPFDFALGGAGLHPSVPIGANGSVIREGQSVMVDMAGNYTAYITDMTRVYAYGQLPENAYRAHEVSLEMHRWLSAEGRPGLPCSEIYEHTLEMATESGFASGFMGIDQQAGFVGHGVGIEINEWPVLSARSQDVLRPGMVFAYEPKIVLPGVGATGVENTYFVTENGIEKLTLFCENIMEFEITKRKKTLP
jgi:Xaa-Pro aminopeptidase